VSAIRQLLDAFSNLAAVAVMKVPLGHAYSEGWTKGYATGFEDGKATSESVDRRMREVDYIVGNEDSLDSEACAALRAVIFDIPDPRRPVIPDAVDFDSADYVSPPSTRTSDGSPESTVEGGEQTP
jgi:hypothetical protein